jgi:hypothetical protein
VEPTLVAVPEPVEGVRFDASKFHCVIVAAFTGAATMATLAMIAIDLRMICPMDFFMIGSPSWGASVNQVNG